MRRCRVWCYQYPEQAETETRSWWVINQQLLISLSRTDCSMGRWEYPSNINLFLSYRLYVVECWHSPRRHCPRVLLILSVEETVKMPHGLPKTTAKWKVVAEKRVDHIYGTLCLKNLGFLICYGKSVCFLVFPFSFWQENKRCKTPLRQRSWLLLTGFIALP